ncbi:MAG: hypothetical protein Q8920_00960 [Bacillota bacterium]|nr:hypothetical protein [Bacillota bacterium]
MFDKLEAYKLHVGPAKCAVDLGDGSERGEYVNQDYIINKLGRSHRNINLMYCYYPLDKGWPGRASEVFKSPDVKFAWDYPYDDYFTYKGGIGGNTDGEPFTCMQDVRRHGQDVTLTLTIDCAVSDEHLIQIARELKPYGRMHLRINHEANGTWFSFNKRYSYQQVADFFVRFHNIIKKEAPNIQTIICIGDRSDKEPGKMDYEEEFKEAVKAADIWSGDYYLALNWGWPYTIAERKGKTHKREIVDDIYEANKFSLGRFCFLNGGKVKPLVISEFNADGDVTGPFDQAEMMKDFYMKVKKEEATWLTGITFYQFRDRGRLALEIEDPNNSEVGIEQPMLDTYREVINDTFFLPEMSSGDKAKLPIRLRWGSAEDSDGLEIPLDFSGNPVFCEVVFDEVGLNAIMEINGQWFYKKPGVDRIDLISAFYRKPLKGPQKLSFKLFAPPASGRNDSSQGDDWTVNYYTEIKKLPQFRIRFEPTETGKYSPWG